MKSRFINKRLAILACSWAVLTVSGCGKPAENNSAENPQEEQPKVANHQSLENSIVGTWLGTATLNRVTLQNKLESVTDPIERRNLQAMAESFLSIQVGARFSEDGKMQFEVQMSGVNGQLHRDASSGDWKIVEVDGSTLIVEKTEYFEDGTSTTQRDHYNFLDDMNHFAMTLPTAPALQECNPIILFERRDLAGNPQVADRVGENPKNTK